MKHTAAFILILALILSIGYYSVNATDFFSGSSHLENARLPRNVQDYETVYISGEEAGFHPMDFIESSYNNNYNNYYDYLTNSHHQDISAALITVISHYDIRCQLTPNEGKKLISELSFKNGYIYVEKFKYTNVRNETRFLDCILTVSDFRIVYLRFYSDEDNVQLSDEAMKSALEEFDSQSKQFYYSISKFDSEIYNTLFNDGRFIDLQLDISNLNYTYDICYDSLLATYEMIQPYIPDDNSINMFWIPPAYFYYTIFNVNENYFVAVAVRHICDKIMYAPNISEPEYTYYQGSIYQSIFFDRSELITIYNARDKYIEGFYAPAYN